MNRKFSIILLLITLLGGILGGCSSPELAITGVWARPGLQRGNTAVYFNIESPRGQSETLLSAAADAAEFVELHRSMLVSPEEAAEIGGGMEIGNSSMESGEDRMGEDMVMVMQQQENVPIPAGETVVFEPGGLHVMMIDLVDDLEEGDTFQLTLVFQNAGEVILDVPVGMP